MLFRGAFGGGATSGKSGSVVASHNSGGQYLRARTTPTNPRTVFQQTVRNGVAALSTAWSRILNATQRAAWNLYGTTHPSRNRLGDVITISGIAAYQRANVARLQAGLARIDTPASTLADPTVDLTGSAFVFGATSGTFTMTGSLPVLGSGTASTFLFYTTPPYSQGVAFPPQNTRLAGTLIGNTTGGAHIFALPFTVSDSTSQMQLVVTYMDGQAGQISGLTFPGTF